MTMKPILQVILFFWLSMGAFAETQTETRLLLSVSSARPGESIWAGVELKMPAGWHTYWRNGGDAGIPTRIEWTLPAGVKAEDTQWPVPEKLISKAGDFTLITYVYNDVVVLLAPLQLARDLPPGPLELKARVSWQECQMILPSGHSDLRARLEIGDKTAPSGDAATWISGA